MLFSPVALGFVFIMGLLLIFLPRSYAVVPIILTASFITFGQNLQVLSLNFYMHRILILFGLIRVFSRNEIQSIELGPVDKLFLLWILSSFLIYIIREQNIQALINRLGFAFDGLVYFIFRSIIVSKADAIRTLKILALVLLPISGAMIIEKTTGRNLFSFMGGVDEFTAVRDSKIRAQGAFMHPITAGVLGATSIPLMIPMLFQGTVSHARAIAFLGLFSGTTICLASSSSGPVIAYATAVIPLVLWPIREHMRTFRWCFLLTLFTLHLVMKAPVWALIGRISEVMGGTGWHRSDLVDAWLKYYSEWLMLGTCDTSHWMSRTLSLDSQMVDVTNHFVRIAVDGGAITLTFFITMLSKCYSQLGKLRRITIQNDPGFELILWCLGCALTAHIVTFLSVSYFDQIFIFWYLLLALISSSGSFDA